MKKTISKILAAALALSMSVSLSACRQGNTASSAGSASQSGASSAAVSSAAAKVTFPLSEPLEFKVFVKNEDTTVYYNDNWVTDYIQKKTNIKLNFIEASGTDVETKLSLIMTGSGNLPDFFLSTGWSKAQTMLYASEGLLIPLNQYLSGAENWNRLNKESPLRQSDLIFPDGNYYSYGFDNEAYHMNYHAKIWYYKPWLDSLNGGKIPTTTEELYQYLKKVKTGDPNGNGQADEIPITGHIQGGSGSDPLTFLTNAFLENNNEIAGATVTPGRGFIVNSGKIEFQLSKPAFKSALQYLNKLNSEGLIDPQAFTQSKDNWKALFKQTTPTVAVATNYNYPSGFDGKADGAWTNWIAGYPLKGPDGVQLSAFFADNYFHRGMGIVSSDCKHPEIAVALMDWLASDENSLIQTNGPKGICWDSASSGTSVDGGTAAWQNLTPKVTDKNGNADYSADGVTEKSYRWSIDAGIIAATSRLRLSMLVKDPSVDLESHLYTISKEYAKYAPSLDTVVPSFAYTEAESKTIADNSLAVMSYANQSTVDFITGTKSIDKDWDSYVKKLDDLGLQTYLKLMQDKYTAYKSQTASK